MEIKKLMVNPEHFNSIYTTEDEMSFEIVTNRLRNVVPRSKMVSNYSYNRKYTLLVDEEYYESAIDVCNEHLFTNNRENNISWITEDGLVVPCGYYQVARAISPHERDYLKLPADENISKEEIERYRMQMMESFRTDINFQYDYLSNVYGINIRSRSYDEEILKLNEFITVNGKGPFNTIKETSRYGKITEREYPILSKRK